MNQTDFAAAIDALLHGEIAPAEKTRLEQHLRNDRSAQQAYVEQLRVHALLGWRRGISAPVELPPRSFSARSWKWAAAISAIAATILLGLVFLARPTNNPPLLTVAQVVRAGDAAYQPGQRLAVGQLPAFTDELEIKFDTGTVVTLVSPAECALIDNLSMRVTRGRLTAKLDPGGQTGFTVHTPSAAVVDLSTEFGVSVEEGGRTDVVVYEGAVDVTPTTADAGTTRLQQGDAIFVEMTGRASRLVSVRRESGKKEWDVRSEQQAGVISMVTDNVADLGSHKCYQIVRAGLHDEALAYVDRDYRWTNVPETLRGADYVMTFNDDKRQSNLQVSVNVVRPARLFVFIDDRSPAPSWLADDGFVDTNWKLHLQETTPKMPQHPFSVWEKRMTEPATVSLGSNSAKGMYAVAALADKVRVACLGDSITAGSGYVGELQSWLGPTHEVKNFGVSGATLLARGDKPYSKEKAYADAIAYRPDVVTVMLGTNDTKPQNFKAVADFATDYKALLAPFLKREKRPKICLCLPVPVYFEGNFGIEQGRLESGIFPAVKAVAQELDLALIDVHTPLLNRPDLFYRDNVHPLGGGANLAAPIYETLTKQKPPVVIPPAPPKALRLACLGDSITEGSGYPSALQQLLGNRFMVKNYGVSSSTLLSRGDKPYAQQAKFAAAKTFEPDAVILMLGTNDTKPKNYEHIADFAKELTSLCDEISAWKSKPKILLALPAPVIGEGNFGIDNGRLEAGVIPAIRQVALEKKLLIVDMNAVLKPYPELFKDRIHPTGGQLKMAQAALGPLLKIFPLPGIPENLLANAGAEEGTDSWTCRGGKLLVVSEPVHTGKAALKVTERKAGYHGPSQNVTANLKEKGMGYYHLRGAVRLEKGTVEATLLVIIKDGRGMRYCKTPNHTISADGWTEFADDVFLGWSGELQEAFFCIETNGAPEIDLAADDMSLSLQPAR